MVRIAALFTIIFLTMGMARSAPVTILALGDSLTSGYGLEPGDAFPVKLEAALRERGHDVKVLNAGVSGDTAAAGLARLEWSLDASVNAVIVELGGNDALRGLPPAQSEQALDGILGKLEQRKLPVLVAGMQAPRNLGPDYAAAFDPMYERLAKKHGALLYPFFLDGVAADTRLNQQDGMHPNSQGVDVIVARMLPMAEQLLAKAMQK